MSNMFYNYDNNIDVDLEHACPIRPLFPDLRSNSRSALICNIKGDPIGLEVNCEMPVTLYFNLVETSGQSLLDILTDSLVKFELITTNHKVALEKTFSIQEVFNSNTNDIVINLTNVDMSNLRKESYGIKLTLVFSDGSYPLFLEQDGLLVIRWGDKHEKFWY